MKERGVDRWVLPDRPMHSFPAFLRFCLEHSIVKFKCCEVGRSVEWCVGRLSYASHALGQHFETIAAALGQEAAALLPLTEEPSLQREKTANGGLGTFPQRSGWRTPTSTVKEAAILSQPLVRWGNNSPNSSAEAGLAGRFQSDVIINEGMAG
ncbi:hypothetical protein N657DRAFT_155078 [Parathielavia appendiculata]|uniref:Uncharacterized protein n=1 Tax=Parathielavia appendiculata TaxID=2587402 RepID=A0AAN6TTN3_9PEZI|nr:hypothetical protein N657DRAFT_155078 [Parathielavia appendiculata]